VRTADKPPPPFHDGRMQFKDRYRVETARLCGKDYAETGTYFVTVCTKGMECWFGEVRNERMVLNAVGMIVVEEICGISIHRNDCFVDAWIVMPNHLHMLVHILPFPETNLIETHRRCVSTDVDVLIPLPRRRLGTLGSIIASWKSMCTKRIWNAGYRDFQWQSRFYDSILRTDRAVENARSYIAMNPVRWHRDRNNHDVAP